MPGPNSETTPKRSDDRVVVIDDRLTRVFRFYVALFPNYREAGKAIGVGKDTIAKYATESTNMAFPVYTAMCREIESRCTRKSIQEEFGRGGLKRWSVDVRSKNGGQIDHVMYEITPGIRGLIQHYTASFDNRSQAARALDLNPRTLKAYANGQIQAFPRSRFQRMIEILTERGQTEEALLEQVGAKTWDEVLVERSRSETLYLERAELLERLVDFLADGRTDLKNVSRPVYNACRRYFGSLGPACDAAMDHLVAVTERDVKALLQQGEVEEARERVLRFERALRSHTTKVRARVHAARKDLKIDWRSQVRELVARKDKVKEAVLKESQFHPDVSNQPEPERLRFVHPYLSDFRSYAREETFHSGELIFHPLFGMGRVTGMADRGQMQVRFAPKVGEKTLAFRPERFV